MKRYWLIFAAVVVLITACAPAQVPEEPAVSVPDALVIPDSLGIDWYKVSAGNTDMYVYKTEGVYDEKSGWVTFNYDGYKLLAVLTSDPNPSDEGQNYVRKFDVQWVEGKSVVRHAVCFDVDWYNANLEVGQDVKYYDVRLPEQFSPQSANQVTTSTYGCGFEGITSDVIYIVHHHLVNSSALQEINKP